MARPTGGPLGSLGFTGRGGAARRTALGEVESSSPMRRCIAPVLPAHVDDDRDAIAGKADFAGMLRPAVRRSVASGQPDCPVRGRPCTARAAGKRWCRRKYQRDDGAHSYLADSFPHDVPMSPSG